MQVSEENTGRGDRLLYTPPRAWGAVGEQIAMRRRAAGFSQLRLAGKLGVVQSTIHQFETGKIRPTRAMLSRIVTVIGGDEAELARLAGYGEVS